MNTQNESVPTHTALMAELALVENELQELVQLQVNATNAAIWVYNTWTSTDAMLEREPSQELISRLEKLSSDADAIKTEADALVQVARERRRKLTRKLKSKVHSPEMAAERERVAKLADANVEAAKEAEKTKADVKNASETSVEASETLLETTNAQTDPQSQTVETDAPTQKRKAAKK